MKPLAMCKLRTAGLASVKSAKFGMVRKNADGSPRAHQGIDLLANKGVAVYAVGNGTIVGINMGLDGYGYTITLKLKDGLFAFYAHLSELLVKVGDKVTENQWIGKTGSTGNAKGMETIARGGHLHFEIRSQQSVGLGLSGRFDPLDYVELDA
ncbi:MAG TPA: M23 family metallopeptidase [Methylotenera sp.]|nr:M23 family metallopeptidase [Methylotenera sp.]